MRFRSVENPKSEQIVIRVTPGEKADIQARAHDCLLPVSVFMLKCAKGRQTRGKLDHILINELRLIGLQVKEIYQAEQPREASELEPVLTAVVQAIIRISEEYRFRI